MTQQDKDLLIKSYKQLESAKAIFNYIVTHLTTVYGLGENDGFKIVNEVIMNKNDRIEQELKQLFNNDEQNNNKSDTSSSV